MMKPSGPRAPDIHGRSFSYCLETFEDFNFPGVVLGSLVGFLHSRSDSSENSLYAHRHHHTEEVSFLLADQTGRERIFELQAHFFSLIKFQGIQKIPRIKPSDNLFSWKTRLHFFLSLSDLGIVRV